MFSGIISEIGAVSAARDGEISICAPGVCAELKASESVAVNGACLTVVARADAVFTVNIIPETARLTNLAALKPHAAVNLELPLRYNERVGGHLLQGHIDGIGVVRDIETEGASKVFRISAASDIIRHVVKKGYIAIDGASLTVVDVQDDWFKFAAIPYTRRHTIIGDYEIGSVANLETDIVVKSLDKLAKGYFK